MIRILHIALEYGDAVLGGLGVVATQMLNAQNSHVIAQQPQFDASIITPFYPILYKKYTNKTLVAEIEHPYNHEKVTSKVYLVEDGKNKHYIIEPCAKYMYLFDSVTTVQQIYGDYADNPFIERIKFFNSAVAAYLGKGPIGEKHPNPQILQLHDWQAALVPKSLHEIYKRYDIKSIFMVHIDNSDSGKYLSDTLSGIGLLVFGKSVQLLKAIGMLSANKIITVSKTLMHETLAHITDDPDLEYLRKIFVLGSVQNKIAGIPNGFNYAKYCPLGKYIQDPNNIYAEKQRNKQRLAQLLRGSRSEWNFDPNLPLILYVGRYAPGKGVATFAQLIEQIKGKASFIALGRGMTDDVFSVISNQSKNVDNIYVTFSKQEQDELIDLVRASADVIFSPSHSEAFGLVLIEGLANGALCLTTGVGGMKDIIQDLNFSDPNNIRGNAIVFDDNADGEYNPSLTKAINTFLELWSSLNDMQKNKLQTRLLADTAKFDWHAPGGTLDQYLQIFKELITTDRTFKIKAK